MWKLTNRQTESTFCSSLLRVCTSDRRVRSSVDVFGRPGAGATPSSARAAAELGPTTPRLDVGVGARMPSSGSVLQDPELGTEDGGRP